MVGTNDIGQKVDFEATVSFVPSGDFSFITAEDEFSVITLEAEVQKNATTGDFGTWTVRDEVNAMTDLLDIAPSTAVEVRQDRRRAALTVRGLRGQRYCRHRVRFPNLIAIVCRRW